jgi:hypothetical protein
VKLITAYVLECKTLQQKCIFKYKIKYVFIANNNFLKNENLHFFCLDLPVLFQLHKIELVLTEIPLSPSISGNLYMDQTS